MGLPLNDLNLLRTFVAVAESASFTGAADRLGIARPQVSLQVRRLEAALGTSLFHRTTRRVALTDAGERLFGDCAPLVRAMADALGSVSAGRPQLAGRLRVSAPVELAVQVLARVVTAFADAHPQVQVELLASDRMQDLVAEGIDVAIRAGWLRPSSARAARLGQFGQAVLAAPSYLARHGTPRRPEELAHHRWIALSLLQSPLTWTFTRRGKDTTVRMKPHLRTDSASALRGLLVNGAGISVGSALDMQADIASGALVRLLPGWSLPAGGLHAVFPPGAHLPAASRAFVEFLRQALASQSPA